MPGITQAQAEAQLALYLAAEAKVLANQEYTVGTRTFKRADLAEIRKGIKEWNATVQQLASGGGGGARVRGLTAG